jgi:hypothetical protein
VHGSNAKFSCITKNWRASDSAIGPLTGTLLSNVVWSNSDAYDLAYAGPGYQWGVIPGDPDLFRLQESLHHHRPDKPGGRRAGGFIPQACLMVEGSEEENRPVLPGGFHI